MDSTVGYGAIVLAGGGARRMGGARKPELRVGGVRMIDRVLAAVAPAGAPIVVGPSDLALPPGVAVTQEVPPGGGPAAAVAAALAASPGHLAPVVAIVAGDLPLLTAEAVGALLAAAAGPDLDGAVYIDTGGRPQWLCGAWRTAALTARVADLTRAATEPTHGAAGPGVAGVALRELFGPLSFARLAAEAAWSDGDSGTSAVPVGEAVDRGAADIRAERPPPWFDCDTEDDIRRAEEWLNR